MGMLAYGAMAGVAGEYLDQSKETRKNDFTLLRDKRLSELRQGDATHASGLVGDREAAARKHGDENYIAPLTSNVVRGGALVQEGVHRPTAGSNVKPEDLRLLTKEGDYTSWKTTRDDYEVEYTTIDEWGTRVTKDGAPSLAEYRNDILDERHFRQLKQAEESIPEDTPEEEKPGLIKRAWDAMFGSDDEAPKEGRGGMLTESTADTEKKEKPKSLGLKMPLSRASKTDPAQMYIELKAQGFDDQNIEDTIRSYFKDPEWTIPPASTLK